MHTGLLLLGPRTLDRLKELSQRKGEPTMYYMREGVALVLDKCAEKKAKGHNAKS